MTGTALGMQSRIIQLNQRIEALTDELDAMRRERNYQILLRDQWYDRMCLYVTETRRYTEQWLRAEKELDQYRQFTTNEGTQP